MLRILLFGKEFTLYHTIPSFTDPNEEASEDIVRKEEYSGN